MAILVKPTGYSKEKWMKVDNVGGVTLFMFSGFAEFGPKVENNPIQNTSIIGKGDNDSAAQRDYVEYDITDMLVGPHWSSVRGICPSVWAAGHDQVAPDDADGMGYQVTAIKKVNVVDLGTFKRIELQISCKVAGGFEPGSPAWGRIPALAYHVSAFGILANPIGTEGLFFGQRGF